MTTSVFGPQLCIHGRKICSACIMADDDAKRAYDTIRQIVTNITLEERLAYPYVALRLSDGGSDGKNYDTKKAAIRHQIHEQQCAYLSFRTAPNGFASPRDAAIFLAFHREAYKAGMRLPDPDDMAGGPDLVMPTTREHLMGQIGRLNARHN